MVQSGRRAVPEPVPRPSQPSDIAESGAKRSPRTATARIPFQAVATTASQDDGDGFALLPVAVQSTDPLLDTHGVPRQVVVDEHVAELKIQALATDLGREQDVNGIPRLLRQGESAADVPSFIFGHASVDHPKPHGVLLQQASQIGERVPERAEHKRLVRRHP